MQFFKQLLQGCEDQTEESSQGQFGENSEVFCEPREEVDDMHV